MFKKIVLALSLVLAGCSATSKPVPVAPPPTTIAAPKEEVKAPVVTTLSATTKVYSGPSWSVALPDNMKVVNQDDDTVVVRADDQTEFRFVRQAGDKSSLEDLTNGLVMAFMVRGHQPDFMGAGVMDKHATSVVGFSGAKGIAVFFLTATGSNTYALIYMGTGSKERVEVVKAALSSVKLTDKVMPAKPVAKPVKK